tara:strand:- start:737 stop:1072 length:336 start_codon:yes stop_codon:yes gene_type:complete
MSPDKKVKKTGLARNSTVYKTSKKNSGILDVDKAFEQKFFCPARFAQEIEGLVKNQEDMTYIDAIVYFCDLNSIDLESVPKLISKPLKEKIKYEAQELNFLKRSSRAKLPL